MLILDGSRSKGVIFDIDNLRMIKEKSDRKIYIIIFKLYMIKIIYIKKSSKLRAKKFEIFYNDFNISKKD